MTAVFPAGTRSACLVGCLLAWLPAVAADQPGRGELEAVMVEQAPKLDGTLDDPLWQKCPPLVLGGCGGDGPLEPRTEAHGLCPEAGAHYSSGGWISQRPACITT